MDKSNMNASGDVSRGRPRSAGLKPLSEVDALATIECIAAVKQLEHWNGTQFLEAFAGAHMALEDEDYVEFSRQDVDFGAEPSTLSRLSRTNYSTRSRYLKGLYLWFSKCYGNILKEKQSEERLYRDERQVLRLGDLLGTELDRLSPHFPEAAAPFLGTYKLYRPFHGDPLNQIQVSKLTMGSKKSPFTCKIESCHFDERLGEDRTIIGLGKFVPNKRNAATAIFQLENAAAPEPEYIGNRGLGGNYILTIHSPEWGTDDHGSHLSFFSGIMVATLGNKPPSAWPVFAMAHRSKKKLEPHVLSAAEMADLPQIVPEELSRGGVYWNEQDSPRTFDRSAMTAPTP